MFEAGKSFTATDTTKTNTVNVAKNGALTYSKNNTLQAGDKFVIDVETSASFVTINNGFDEVVEVNDGKIEYRVWNIEKDVTITASDAALSISRIDYYVVEPGSVITYAGVVKDKITTNPIGDVDVKFVSTQANETVETRTNDNGEYYLLLSSPATGVITYVDGDYLDEKVELNNETSSKTNVDEDLVQAIHVTGIVYYED
ncbi:MAG: hypothetical protein Q4F54_05215 [Coriobacteriia bacterium]|nr:hypothetical protein [Coriobacteriia bacterium]